MYIVNKISNRIHSWCRVVEQLHQVIILGFDWFQHVNPEADKVTELLLSRIALFMPIHHSINIELYNFKVLLHLLHANRLANYWFIFS